jgi:hypothetical protein
MLNLQLLTQPQSMVDLCQMFGCILSMEKKFVKENMLQPVCIAKENG